LSYSQRERKRRRRDSAKAVAAGVRGQKQSRASGSSSGKWWLTLLTRTQACAKCGLVIRDGKPAVYRHRPMEVRCQACASKQPDSSSWRPSVRWEQEQRRRRKRQLAMRTAA
jgi:hypothetical protein